MRYKLLFYWIVFSGLIIPICGSAQSTTHLPVMTPPLTKQLIDSVDQILQRFYIFPDKAIVMGKQLQHHFKQGQYQRITNPHQLAAQLGQDLQDVHSDGHLFIRYDPKLAKALQEVNPSRRRIGDSLALLTAIDQNFGLNRVEILDGNIGYLPVNSFTSFVERARPVFTAALRFLSQTRAIILDMRFNSGGNPEMVSQLGSYFFTVRTPFTTIENRIRDSTFIYWADPDKADNLRLAMPVYILTARSTFSAAEDFSYSMQQAKRAIVVGDTTGGGAHPAGSFLMGQDFLINLPFAQSINPYSKTNWEGIGVRPDIAVKSDLALEKAQEIILQQAMAQAANDGQHRKLQWAIDELKARQKQFVVPVEALGRYIGDYRGLLVYEQEGKLWCKNTGRGNQITQLWPIMADWFTLNEEVHFQFISEPAGDITGLKMHWRDGREIPIGKTK